MTVTPRSELSEASEGLGGALIIRGGVFKLEVRESVRRVEDEDDFGDEPELSRSLECRLPNGGFTSFEKKPGAMLSAQHCQSIHRPNGHLG
jgi:hypothetical protein